MNLELLNVVISVFSFLIPFIISYMIFKSRKIRNSLLYSVIVAILIVSLLAYLAVGFLFP